MTEDQLEQETHPTDSSDRTDRSDAKPCPSCGQPMILRTARQGASTGARFWGCSGYPACKSTQPRT